MATCSVDSENSGRAAISSRHAAVEGGDVGVFPRRLLEHVRGQSVLIHRTQQAHAAFDRAVVEHEARRGDQDGAAFRTGVAHRARAAHVESVGKRQGAVALLAQDGEDLRLGAGLVRVDRAAGSDRSAIPP